MDQIPNPPASKRLMSLDALRGANFFFIMGGASLLAGLAQFWPDSTVWQWIKGQMNHVPWDGFAHHDMIFPTFLFIAGCAFPFSLAKQRSKGRSTCAIVAKTISRGLILVLLGILYNNSVSFDFANLRYASVLGHIGLAWMFAALFTIAFGPKTRFGILAFILVGYWLLLRFTVAPDAPEGAGCYSTEGSIVGYVDRLCMPGRLLIDKVHDPEGLLSLVPAIGTALLGVFAGEFLRKDGVEKNGHKKALTLLIAGIILVVLGRIWNLDFPINKNLWTSSFVCFVGGLSTISLAVFYWIIDVVGWKSWAFFFVVIGMNSITIYFAPRLGLHTAVDFFINQPLTYLPESWLHIGADAGYIIFAWLFLYFLYRKKLFFKV